MSSAKTVRRAISRGTVLATLTWWLAIGGHLAGGGMLPDLNPTHLVLLILGVAGPAVVAAFDDPRAKVTPAAYLLTAQLWVHVVLCHASTIHLHDGYHPANGFENFLAHNQMAAAGHHHDHGLGMVAAHLGAAAVVAMLLPLGYMTLDIFSDWLTACWRLPAPPWRRRPWRQLPAVGQLHQLRDARLTLDQHARGPPLYGIKLLTQQQL